MAWMRMMGAESLGYHEHTVLGRDDDPVADAQEYYASRGETPMVWGGGGAAGLGLSGEVELGDWRAVFAAGGARHPDSGEHLVHCLRPGMELVVSPHKSVAELGVIGRAEHMHQILDAERDATMAYLDGVVAAQGGRRGRAQVRTQTEGLTWAVSRHATSRAGDPQPHDHVLVANVVRMADEHGGWKALDTGVVRDHLHAATAVGRMAAAAKAVELGFGIEPDEGRSGHLGGWAIAGIAEQAWQVHATRSAQIDAAVGQGASYRARSVAARTTRDPKAHDHMGDLVGRWRQELAEAGYPAAKLVQSLEQARLGYEPPSRAVVEEMLPTLLAPAGRLASEKTFTRADVIVAVAPYLHGLAVSALDEAVEKVLSCEQAVVLPAVGGAREPVWAAACVLEDERRIAELAAALAARPGAAVGRGAALAAVRAIEQDRGFFLTPAQAEVAFGLLTSGHSVDLVLGVAGSGKTSTLAAVRAGFEAAGYRVVGTAVSGQAAQALGEGAGIESRTVASLAWRLEHGREALSARHVLVLDEGAMSADADVAKLLGAVEASGAKLVVAGDYRQLGAIGPGGALEALASRHPGHVWTLRENLRQRERAERQALEHLRHGNIASALGWYAERGRLHPVGSPDAATAAMVSAWATDVSAGRDAILLAYHRSSVDALNASARQAWDALGRLSGPELEAPGGRHYRAGDRVTTLAPGPGGAWVTSQRAVVSSVNLAERSLVAVTPEGGRLRMGADDIASEKLGYGYAMTAHRAQGATVDAAHVLADGGGRELAYVAMSRARGPSHTYVVAADLASATDRLGWEWGQERRQSWAVDRQGDVPHSHLYPERARLAGTLPPERSAELARARHNLARTARDLEDLCQGEGRWAGHRAGVAARALRKAADDYDHALAQLDAGGLGPWARHRARHELKQALSRSEQAERLWHPYGEHHARYLYAQRQRLQADVAELAEAQHLREDFVSRHPDVPARLIAVQREVKQREALEDSRRWQTLLQRERQPDRDRALGRGPEHEGLGIDL